MRKNPILNLVACVGLICAAFLATPPASAKETNEPVMSGISFDASKLDAPPHPRFRPVTIYPPFLVEEKVTGEAKVAFHVTPTGFVDEVKVLSATHDAFGGCAMSTVARMVFKPATKDGKPVDFIANVSFKFELK
jgi:TonB family protein